MRTETLRIKLDRSASVLGMMQWFAGQEIPVLPIHGIVDGCCTCGVDKCTSPGKHPISSLVSHGVKDATIDLKTIRRWHRKYPNMNYAIATKGLAVIDCDSKAALQAFRSSYRPPPTFTVKTARGFHYYYRGEMHARNGVRSKLDIKSGPGSYVVGPGSRHASGAIYAVWEDEPIADLPDNVASIAAEPPEDKTANNTSLIPKGQRNTILTGWAGYLRRLGAPSKAILDTLRAANDALSDDPLPDSELRSIARSISKKPGKEWPTLVPFSEVPEEELDWIWYPYICAGTVGLLDGDPGEGKSQLCVWVCARVSQGDLLPNGDPMPPANCFLFNFEDLPGAVIRKRLEANGADLSRVFIQSRRFQLTQEMVDWLEAQIAKHKPRLVFLDPIQAFMSGVDASNNIEVRGFMEKLVEIAERQRCAIITVRHFGKGPQDRAMKKGIGATDFVGIARSQWGLARRRDGVRGFIVFHFKANSEKGQAMLFTMGDADGRKGEQPKITFDRFEDIDADTFFSEPLAKRGPVQNEQEDAKGYLAERLTDGPKPVKALKTDAEARGIGSSTLNRAADALGVIKAKGEDGRWYWSIPPEG
ncbi:bifunctional DNA primase/polymerase [Sphingorhabdus arenilitoris]|uniref:Bifunctional DNA primase/polymerase n=2 Tax=Sphingorhabdus arenilitoris TaxID=1490041 RepID=A0ABV8RD70_9SPHN